MARLAWHLSAPQGLGLAIERSSGGDFTEIARIDPAATKFVDTTVTRRATYSYRVRSLATDGASSASEVVTVTVRGGHDSPLREIGRRDLRR